MAELLRSGSGFTFCVGSILDSSRKDRPVLDGLSRASGHSARSALVDVRWSQERRQLSK